MYVNVESQSYSENNQCVIEILVASNTSSKNEPYMTPLYSIAHIGPVKKKNCVKLLLFSYPSV